MRSFSTENYLKIYSGTLTLVFGITLSGGLSAQKQKTKFDEIEVRRIDIVEPDGTVRLIISDKAEFPGAIIKGKEFPHETRRAAGLLFFDNEGTESGGLIFAGGKTKDGKVESGGHLSFDQYMQDQVLSIDANEENGRRRSGIAIWDRGDYPITEAIDAAARIGKLPESQQGEEWQKFQASHGGDAPRAYLGRSPDRSVGLTLKDTAGRDRLVLRVGANGSPALQFLDDRGLVTSQFPAAEKR
jgi:hypothetical protein